MTDTIDNSAALQGFLQAARLFVASVDSIPGRDEQEVLRELHSRLAALQLMATQLPHVTMDGNDIAVVADAKRADRDALIEAISLEYPTFHDVLSYVQGSEIETSALTDDLSDIYDDVQDGIALVEAGYPNDALWHWRVGYFTYWGKSLTDVQTAIWQSISNAYENANEDAPAMTNS